ncbi:MAG TPA: FAD-dependent oxidoreductase [Planctomycetota bacterium]|nr:FAD-dependent oxidoreductase [Planctomycetota bacterium]
MKPTSLWIETTSPPRYPPLTSGLHADVTVIGGGIMGVTTAYLLKRIGLTVVLIERDRCGGADTGHTTAHLTSVTDLRPSDLVKKFGQEGAQSAWRAGEFAIQSIHEFLTAEGIRCDFAWIPGFLHASLTEPSRDEVHSLQADAKAVADFGGSATFVDSVPLVGRPGVRFANQARLHPLKYLYGLLQTIPGSGSHVFEETTCEEIQDDPPVVKANGHEIHSGYVIIATHVPLMGKTGLTAATMLQSKLASYTTYVLGATAPSGAAPDAAFWDTANPYHYLRIQPQGEQDLVLFGGADHKTGQISHTQKPFDCLEQTLFRLLPHANLSFRWSGQVVETNDGLPFLGETAPHQFVGTGFGGNGMTFGTLAAVMARDAALGRRGPWADLFDVHRKKVLGGTLHYLRENLDYPYYLLKDWITQGESMTPESLRPGEGKILSTRAGRVAASRDPDGTLHTVSAVCTHMGCLVRWNEAERTWDCPCHGSRFHADGSVLAGPAEKPLEAVQPEPIVEASGR